ncbi:membrane associated rhomboid family serine protease [Actinoplanes octamycinicus]|uniref:Membrane associated rhomboid family serine protease n=1 Tax=Actinoplanes octamycinicus TaxID=135948 RepID=A0A7W7GTN0_9ACTN|nr:membrane associated rhomboid family serine protease [Actinoplanes octamycinicus]
MRSIIALNFLVMAVSVAFGGLRAIAGAGGFFNTGGAPTRVTRAFEVLGYARYGGDWHGIAAGEWYRLVTAMFVHYGALHLLLNMMLLWQIGSYLEAKFGPARFLALYFLAGFGGNVAVYALQEPYIPAAGASTATFGLVIGIIIVNRRLALDISSLVPLLVMNLIYTFALPGISVEGHLGGLAAGAAATVVLAYAKLPHRTAKQVIGCSILFVVLVAVAIARTVQILN